MKSIKSPTSKFVKVKCKKCNNEQIVFNKASTQVKCLVCGEPLVKTTGSIAKILGEVIGVLE